MTKLQTLKDLNAAPLMESWEDIIESDNRRGVLAGLDKHGAPMVPVKYRPIAPGPFRVGTRLKGKGVKQINAELKRFRLNQSARKKRGRFEGLSPFGPGFVERNNNLRSSEYKILGGPPLAPRDQFSRVITNLTTDHKRVTQSQWIAWGEWKDVMSVKGFHFLPVHFEGLGRMPKRDLRGVRPEGVRLAIDALHKWAALEVREHFGR
jgi:hypothetical protein